MLTAVTLDKSIGLVDSTCCAGIREPDLISRTGT